jgi:hypothetical protein
MKRIISIIALSVGICFGANNSAIAASESSCLVPESVLTDLIKEYPDRLITVLEEGRLDEFLNNLMRTGNMAGSLPYVEKIYVVSAKMLPGFDTPHVWLFLVQDNCIIRKIPAIRSYVEAAIPQ